MTEFDSFPYTPQDPQPVPAPPAARCTATKRDLIFAAVLLLCSILFINSLIYAQAGVGLGVGFAGFFLILELYLRKKRRALTLFSVFCGVFVLLGACCFVCSGDRFILFLLFNAEILLSSLALRESMALRSGESLLRAICDLCRIMFVLTFGRIAKGCYALFVGKTQNGARKNRVVMSALIGLSCAIPVLFVLIPLLVNSDAAFEGLIQSVDSGAVRECVVSVLFGAFLCLLLFSQMISMEEPRLGKPRGTAFRGFDATVIGVFLAAVSSAYLLYLFSQLAYFFSAFRGLLPKDYSVAQYARRGFFEMCWIVFLNLCMVLLAAKLCRKREDGRLPGAIRGLLLFLCAFSIAMVAAALSKMLLYIRSFGMTRLRILTSVFMVFLAAVVIFAALRLFVKKLPLWRLTVIVGMLCLLSAGFVNVDRVVASYNVHAYQSGRLETVDVDTLQGLSDAAVPYLTELLSDEDLKVSHKAALVLVEHAKQFFTLKKAEGGYTLLESGFDPRSFNLSHERAKRYIRQYWQEIQSQAPANLD